MANPYDKLYDHVNNAALAAGVACQAHPSAEIRTARDQLVAAFNIVLTLRSAFDRPRFEAEYHERVRLEAEAEYRRDRPGGE